LVAHHVGAEVHADSPRVSAELPETGERFEGLLPPVVAAPAFAIRTLAAVLGLGLRLWIAGLLIGVIGQAAAVWAAKRDPQFVDVVRRHLRISGYLGI
jgi:Flp pilus assembly CpaF family ATPase